MNSITGEEMLEEMTKLDPSNLNESTRKLYDTIMKALDERDELTRKLKIKDAYLQLIIDLAYDYDGFNDIDGLKGLVDELSEYAKMALKNDYKSSIYIDGRDRKLNILDEVINDNS